MTDSDAKIVAEGRGFIQDPTGSLEAVGVSVFHQLHCLVSLNLP